MAVIGGQGWVPGAMTRHAYRSTPIFRIDSNKRVDWQHQTSNVNLQVNERWTTCSVMFCTSAVHPAFYLKETLNKSCLKHTAWSVEDRLHAGRQRWVRATSHEGVWMSSNSTTILCFSRTLFSSTVNTATFSDAGCETSNVPPPSLRSHHVTCSMATLVCSLVF